MDDLLVEEAPDASHVGADGIDEDATEGTDVNEGATDGEDELAHTRVFDDLDVSRKNR